MENSAEKPGDYFRIVSKLAREIVAETNSPQRAALGDLGERVKRRCSKLGIPYRADVIARAVDAALAVDRKQAATK